MTETPADRAAGVIHEDLESIPDLRNASVSEIPGSIPGGWESRIKTRTPTFDDRVGLPNQLTN